jgi:hypothetical protein
MRVGRVHQGDGVIPVDAPLDARGFFRFGHLARRFQVSGLVMWLFPCRGPMRITKPLRDRRSGQWTARSAVVRTWAAVAAK